MYGSVKKGAKYTRFRLEITLNNNCVFTETQHVANDELQQYPRLYKWTLDNMTETLIKRVDARPQ